MNDFLSLTIILREQVPSLDGCYFVFAGLEKELIKRFFEVGPFILRGFTRIVAETDPGFLRRGGNRMRFFLGKFCSDRSARVKIQQIRKFFTQKNPSVICRHGRMGEEPLMDEKEAAVYV